MGHCFSLSMRFCTPVVALSNQTLPRTHLRELWFLLVCPAWALPECSCLLQALEQCFSKSALGTSPWGHLGSCRPSLIWIRSLGGVRVCVCALFIQEGVWRLDGSNDEILLPGFPAPGEPFVCVGGCRYESWSKSNRDQGGQCYPALHRALC